MNDKNSIIQIVMIAFAVALVVTFGVRLLLISSTSNFNLLTPKRELSMGDIPLIIEEAKKQTEVLIVSKDIKKDSKITLKMLSWRKWPLSAIQSKFIARDIRGTPMNSKGDYGKALEMWAASDIPAGVPLTIKMLTAEDPQKKLEKDEKARKLLENQKASAEFIRNGMRAVTFPIDQRSASSLNVLCYNDLVDALIMERRGDKIKTHKYKALKILAIDGATKFIKNIEDKDKGKIEGKPGTTAVPKNITLEVKEELVDTMLRQLGNGGVVLSIRSSTEAPKSEEDNTEDEEATKLLAQEALLQNIMNMNKMTSAAAIIEERDKKNRNEKDLFLLVKSMNSANDGASDQNGEKGRFPGAEHSGARAKSSSEKIEIVSGRMVGKETPEKKSEVVLYRKLNPQKMAFSKDGQRDGGAGANAGSAVPAALIGGAAGAVLQGGSDPAASIKSGVGGMLPQVGKLL
ncbi:MAG: SAF domain-containing protein [Holosporaceae bacterium]|jgi:Flp pilus assembly protein CpaB|nr:SAF domain-containing protein [Holosporaceae bacterium]